MGFSRQWYRSGLPCPLLGDLSDPGIEPTAPMSPALKEYWLPAKLSGNPLSSLTRDQTCVSCLARQILNHWLPGKSQEYILYEAIFKGSPGVSDVKNMLAIQETRVLSLGQEDPRDEGMATRSRILGASLMTQIVKNLLEMWKTWVWSLGQEEPLKKGKATPLQYSCQENLTKFKNKHA